MNRRTLGILAGAVGSALGAWWFARQRASRQAASEASAAHDHGTVIYRNTRTAAEGDAT